MLYLTEHFATAVLESVVHTATTAPPPAHAQWVTITDEVAVLELNAWSLPAGWDEPDDQSIARAQGAAWVAAGTSACLIVPSVPGRPYERNVVVNTRHPDYAKLVWEPAQDVPWDPRLFA